MFIIEIVIWTFETENALTTEGLGGIKDYLFHMNQSIISLHSRIGKIHQSKNILFINYNIKICYFFYSLLNNRNIIKSK